MTSLSLDRFCDKHLTFGRLRLCKQTITNGKVGRTDCWLIDTGLDLVIDSLITALNMASA